MRPKSRLWLLSAGLLAVGAALIAAAVTVYWQPCAGSMLSGSVFNEFRYGPDFSDACLVAMDEAPVFPMLQPGAGWTLTGGLGWVALILLATSWLVLLPTLRLGWPAALALAAPSLLSIALAVLTLVAAFAPAGWSVSMQNGLVVGIELAALVAMVMVGIGGIVRTLPFMRYIIVLGASTAAGWIHQIFEYMVAISLSDANWDSPPGTGYFTAMAIAASALVTVLLWVFGREPVDSRTTVPVLGQAGPS